jgi:hypothetical protein
MEEGGPPMTYAEWKERPSSVNDAECATVVMRWKWVDVVQRWKAPGNKMIYAAFSPTTDRNATAMLVEGVARRGRDCCLHFSLSLGDALGACWRNIEGTLSVSWTPVDVLCAAPSLVAWACCESCREVNARWTD